MTKVQSKVSTKILQLPREREKLYKLIDTVVSTLEKGGIACLPTETCYIVAGDATREDVVSRIIEMKGPKEREGFGIVVADVRMAKEYAQLDEVAEHLCHSFMPGPLTLIAKGKTGLAKNLLMTPTAGVSFKISGNAVLREISNALGKPITSTSANYADQPTISKSAELKTAFEGKADLIIDAGDLPRVQQSTIVDLRTSPPSVKREGTIPLKDILKEIEAFKNPKEDES
jgi:L-threonylcarbamoyladenylate synthase